MTEIGRHLLGSIPSPPDPRDYRLENYLGLGAEDSLYDPNTEIALAVKELKATTVSYPRWAATHYPDVTKTHWWQAFNHLANAAGVVPPPPVGTVEWINPDRTLDQGNYGTCVGNGVAQFGNTDPINDHFNETVAREIYYEATVLDGWPDDPDAPGGGQQGATVRSGIKALQNRHRISTYAFASSTASVTAWIQQHGPVVIGVNWYTGMFDTDANGYVKVTGQIEGGHCVLLRGFLADEAAYLGENSWGEGWGDGGSFKIKVADFARLLSENGEAVTSVELPL